MSLIRSSGEKYDGCTTVWRCLVSVTAQVKMAKVVNFASVCVTQLKVKTKHPLKCGGSKEML